MAVGHKCHAATLLRPLARHFVPDGAKREGLDTTRRWGKYQHPLPFASLDTVGVSDLVLSGSETGAFGWGGIGRGNPRREGNLAGLRARVGRPEPVKGMRSAIKNAKARAHNRTF